METIINKRAGIVTKDFSSESEAIRYCHLYSSYENHAKPLFVQGHRLAYTYIEGSPLSDILSRPASSRAHQSITRIAQCLSKTHSDCEITANIYDTLCAQRVSKQRKISDFLPSPFYQGVIHGDVNTNNIIVAPDGEVGFIDRLSEYGDIMFDFTFIMSILCMYLQTGNYQYVALVKEFFLHYTVPRDNKEGFYTSFRNNFACYGLFVYEDTYHHDQYPEWRYGKTVADDVTKYTTIIDYVNAIS